jgi:hypothetical protein
VFLALRTLCGMLQSLTNYSALAKADAELLTIPHLLLASKDENPAEVKGYVDYFSSSKVPGEAHTYATMFHGWMAARAKLSEEEYLKGYEKG